MRVPLKWWSIGGSNHRTRPETFANTGKEEMPSTPVFKSVFKLKRRIIFQYRSNFTFPPKKSNISIMKTIETQNGKLRAVLSNTGACIKELWYDGVQVGKDGITVGRYANRIGGARFSLNGREFELIANEGRNCLHGGPEGFADREWTLEAFCHSNATFSLISEDGDQGFPGRVKTLVRFEMIEDDSLKISFTAETNAPTVINLTNHLYFNMGEENAKDHILQIFADQITETDAELIPTGKLLKVNGTRFDFREPRVFVPGYDDNFVLCSEDTHKAAVLQGINSGIVMKVYTDQPGLQLYNTDTHICLEAQHFADSPNHTEFPDTELVPGEKYDHFSIYAFSRNE